MSDLEQYDGYEAITFGRADGVLTVALNRPERLNAVDRTMHTELARVFADVRDDTATRAVVLTGVGDAFCAGGHLENMATAGPGPRLDQTFAEGRRIVVDLLDVPQPVIAAVRGPAMGLGATLALLCDVVYAGESAVFADPHVRVGVGAGDGGIVAWPWLVGMSRAKQYLLSGDRVGAVEAERIGLVNHVIADDDLLPAAHAFAVRLASGAVRATQGTKSVLNKLMRDTANMVLDTSLLMEKECFECGDHLEPVRTLMDRPRRAAR